MKDILRAKALQSNGWQKPMMSKFPDGFDFQRCHGLSREAREKLSLRRPATLGQASRMQGITPSDIAVLFVYARREQAGASWPQRVIEDESSLLRAGLRELELQGTSGIVPKLLDYGSFLLQENARTNLTGARSLASFITNHVLDSLAPLPLLDLAGSRCRPREAVVACQAFRRRSPIRGTISS